MMDALEGDHGLLWDRLVLVYALDLEQPGCCSRELFFFQKIPRETLSSQ